MPVSIFSRFARCRAHRRTAARRRLEALEEIVCAFGGEHAAADQPVHQFLGQRTRQQVTRCSRHRRTFGHLGDHSAQGRRAVSQPASSVEIVAGKAIETGLARARRALETREQRGVDAVQSLVLEDQAAAAVEQARRVRGHAGGRRRPVRVPWH